MSTIGNPLTDGTWTYTWEHGRELASMTNGSTTWTNTYDAQGMRVKRTNGSTTYSYVYSGSKLVQMKKDSTTLNFYYDASNKPFCVDYNGTAYYYNTNIQGDVIGIMNSSGTVVVSYTYDAWGKPLSVTGSMSSTLGALNPLRYRSYVYDSETSLYYLQSRYYDPEVGRFLNVDSSVSTGQGFIGNNLFAYCLNNPVNGCDPCGTCFHRWDFWNDCEKCGGRTFGEKAEDAWEDFTTWCEDSYNHINNVHQQQQQANHEILLQQNKMFADAANLAWDAYEHSIELQAQQQYQQDMATKAFVSYQFSSPEIISSNLAGLAALCDIGAAYCGGVALKWAIPTLGMSVKTAGTVGGVLILASAGFSAAAWLVDRIALEG